MILSKAPIELFCWLPSFLPVSSALHEEQADCVLHGESSRKVIFVEGNYHQTFNLRALNFLNGQHEDDGGACIGNIATLDIILCLFKNCRATDSSTGGGAIYLNWVPCLSTSLELNL